ncbi:cytochrome c biogenesis protein CcsA [Kamptonema cortianum]|nr:cytochrome c biogenesis protein CcsA [Kamptonema cortianum]
MTPLLALTLPAGTLTWLGYFGSFAVLAVLVLCLATIIVGLKGSDSKGLGGVLLLAATAGNFIAISILATLMLTSQFQFEYVRKHSALDHELHYRLAATWSGQEGSFLLWAVCSSLFVALLYPKVRHYRRWFEVVAAAFLAALAGILAFESPFTLTQAGVDLSDGFGMPPSLMNYWVVIHPPTIFLGFGSLTALFAMSMAAMLHKDHESWVPIIRPLTIVATTLLGLGLCMGGFWAYETLGWGGFWAWDPVETHHLFLGFAWRLSSTDCTSRHPKRGGNSRTFSWADSRSFSSPTAHF